MLYNHLLKIGDRAKRSEHNAVHTRALSETFMLHDKECTNLRLY